MTQLTKARIAARISTKKTIHLNTVRSPRENNATPTPKPEPPSGRLGRLLGPLLAGGKRPRLPSCWRARPPARRASPRSTLVPMPPTAITENWKEQPDAHDYPAAEDFLSLLMPPAKAKQIVGRLRKAAIVRRKGKDLLRTSRLPPLLPESFHVARDLKKVKAGKQLSPVLLVRGQLASDVPLTIADGYHRICASYHLNEDADIPCRIVDVTSR